MCSTASEPVQYCTAVVHSHSLWTTVVHSHSLWTTVVHSHSLWTTVVHSHAHAHAHAIYLKPYQGPWQHCRSHNNWRLVSGFPVVNWYWKPLKAVSWPSVIMGMAV